MTRGDERDPIVGRERELASVSRLLEPVEEGLRVLLLEGEPGIGKTTVWEHALADAAERGYRVLACRPAEAEAKLAFTALGDLLAPIADHGLPGLPEPQRAALEVALLRAAPSGAPPDRRAVGTAVYSLLRRSAEERPLAVAVDDIQWLDRASRATLSFALRRLGDSPVAVLAARRLEPDRRVDALDLEAGLPGRVEHLWLGPLSLSGLYHLIRARVGHVFARPTLRRIAQASGGNPLFALELARVLVETGARPGPGEPLPVPETLGALLAARVERLPAAVRDVLLAAASLSNPDLGSIGEALGEDAVRQLVVAEDAGLVEIREGRVRFGHPLLASTVYSSAPEGTRRAVHRRLAEVLSAPEERARHEALGAAGPDERVAVSLDAAAGDADSRGAPEVAVEFSELACGLTPPRARDDLARRMLDLCGYLFRAGDADEARRLLEALVDEHEAGRLRACALELLARLLHVAGTAPEAVSRCRQALAEAGSDPELRARIHATLALVSWHDFELAREHARAALDLLDRLDDPDPGVLSQALMAYVEGEFYAGRAPPADAVQRGLELERLAPSPVVADRMSAALGVWLKYQGDFAEARKRLEAARRAAIDEGDESSLPYVIGHLPQLELWTGNWLDAERYALEHLELAEGTAQPDQRRQALFNLSLVHALVGSVEEARAEAEELQAEAEEVGDDWGASNAGAVLGLLELSLGRAREAAEHLRRNFELRERIAATEPIRAYADYVESLVELGELDRAEKVASLLDARSRASGRAALLAVSSAARGLLAAARGDLDGAAEALEAAIAQHERVTVPFDLARTLVAVGQVRRRRGERKAAREALEEARRIFEQLGAPLWAARADAELRRVPIRRGAPQELTPTEEQVAELVAVGRTSREVAQALFVSPKTVEANLTRIYRKLGIRSRAELGARMSERARAAAPPKP